MHDAGRMTGQAGDSRAVHSPGGKPFQCGIAARVASDCAHERRVGTQGRGMHDYIRGRAAEVIAVGKQVPQHFACANDQRPRRRWISSSGTPLVSGTIVSTQTSCSAIMPQKKRKMVPGWNALTISGNTVVSSAANTQ